MVVKRLYLDASVVVFFLKILHAKFMNIIDFCIKSPVYMYR